VGRCVPALGNVSNIKIFAVKDGSCPGATRRRLRRTGADACQSTSCTGDMEHVLLTFALKNACQRTALTVSAIARNLAPSVLGSVITGGVSGVVGGVTKGVGGLTGGLGLGPKKPSSTSGTGGTSGAAGGSQAAA
jgi:hypothetical protein